MDPYLKDAHRKFLIVLGVLTGIASLLVMFIEPWLVVLVLLGAFVLWLAFWAFIGFLYLFLWNFS